MKTFTTPGCHLKRRVFSSRFLIENYAKMLKCVYKAEQDSVVQILFIPKQVKLSKGVSF